MNNNKIIIGLVGHIASGKDTVANYMVEKYGAVSVSFSAPLRDVLKRLYIPINRQNLAWFAQSIIDKFGGNVISNILGKEIENIDKELIVVPNIRREDDLFYFKNIDNFILVGIEVDSKVRYDRLTNRNQNEDDKSKTWEEFQKDSELSTELEIDGLIQKSKYKINNNTNEEDLYKQIDELMQKIKRS